MGWRVGESFHHRVIAQVSSHCITECAGSPSVDQMDAFAPFDQGPVHTHVDGLGGRLGAEAVEIGLEVSRTGNRQRASG